MKPDLNIKGTGPNEREVPWRDLIVDAITTLPAYAATNQWAAVTSWSGKWLSGGLSGASVVELLPNRPSDANGRFNPAHRPLIAKADTSERIAQEVARYRTIPVGKRGREIPGARAALLLYPPEKQAPAVLRALATREKYSVLLYEHAASNWDGSPQRLVWSLDEALNDDASREPALPGGLEAPISATLRLVSDIFHSAEPQGAEIVMCRLDLARVPWADFMPLALMASSVCTEWQRFVENLQECWEAKAQNSPDTRFVPRLSHGDLRCANVLTVLSNGHRSVVLIDYGMVSDHDCPLSDYARLEADILLRVALSRPAAERDQVLNAVLMADSTLKQPEWSAPSEPAPLRIIATIRAEADRVLDATLGADPRDHAGVYRTFLFGHAVRMVRRYDPALNEQHDRIWYLWFVLSLARRLLGGKINLPKPPETIGSTAATSPVVPQRWQNHLNQLLGQRVSAKGAEQKFELDCDIDAVLEEIRRS